MKGGLSIKKAKLLNRKFSFLKFKNQNSPFVILVCRGEDSKLLDAFLEAKKGNGARIAPLIPPPATREKRCGRGKAYIFICEYFVQTERFELSWIAPLAPKASAYTNSATSACRYPLDKGGQRGIVLFN